MGGVMIKLKTIVKRMSYVLLMSFIYLTAIPKLANTENLVITTYYPAPYGGYVSLLTTNNTWLARDAGKVGIGTSNPQYKLDVNGDIRITGKLYEVCSWRWDDGSYKWHYCAAGEKIVGFAGKNWTTEPAYPSGNRLVPTNGYMICCKIE
jgi:hypothetical protein